ncbi:MAG: hypothetical protein IJ189_07750 [Clostridia bacterium]|nr:hypothetical protein [Clostridia bacterium]
MLTVYIASPDADALERMLTHDERFFTVGSGDGMDVIRDIERLCPDVAVMDEILTGADGQAVLRRLEDALPTPPRVALLKRLPGESTAADAVCSWPCEAEKLQNAVEQAGRQPVPALAAVWAKTREAVAAELLKRLGVPEGLKGYRYLLNAVSDCACAPGLLKGSVLYPLLARRWGTTAVAAEKAIRTAIEHTWLQGNLLEIQRLFGFSVDAEKGKPTNLECIAMLAEHARRAMKRKMKTK